MHFSEMKKKLGPDNHNIKLYTNLISAAAKHKDYEKVSSYMTQMRNEGVKPNTITYNSLIAGDLGKEMKKDLVVEFEIPKQIFTSREGNTMLTDLMIEMIAES